MISSHDNSCTRGTFLNNIITQLSFSSRLRASSKDRRIRADISARDVTSARIHDEAFSFTEISLLSSRRVESRVAHVRARVFVCGCPFYVYIYFISFISFIRRRVRGFRKRPDFALFHETFPRYRIDLAIPRAAKTAEESPGVKHAGKQR